MTELLPVARHYVFSWFLIDFLAVVPIDAIARAATADPSAGAQAQLLSLAYVALSLGREAWGGADKRGAPAGAHSGLSSLLVPTVNGGLAQAATPVWSHWATFGVACPC